MDSGINQINLLQNSQCNLKALVIGGSGAVGRELIKYLCLSKNWIEISVIVRRELEVWSNLEGKEKLRIIKVVSLDEIQNHSKYNFQGYNTVFCTLGSRVKEGEAQFRKVDFTYPIWSADLALFFKIPHYSICSSTGANHKSCFLYLRVKGEVENELKKKNFNCLSIFRPGALIDRDNDSRCIEKCLKCCSCCGSQILAKDCALVMRDEAEQIQKTINVNNSSQNCVKIYENKEMVQMNHK